MKEIFVQVKEEIGQLVRSIESGIKVLDFAITQMDSLEANIGNLKSNLESEYKEIERAIKTDNINLLIAKVNTKELDYILNMKSTKEKLTQAITQITQQLTIKQTLNDITKFIKVINEIHQRSIEKVPKLLEKYIYGVRNPQDDCKKLFRYDIDTMKTNTLIKVPRFSTITQTPYAVYVSGDGDPIVNTLSQFIEESNKLLQRESMKYIKNRHKTELISRNRFMSIGGYNGKSAIPYCEEYSILENKWTEVSSLNIARYHSATALLGNFLYVIGGVYAVNEIEQLDLTKRLV